MKPAPFAWHAPTSLDDALALKARHGDAARFLAGGQSLVPAMNFLVAHPPIRDRGTPGDNLSHADPASGMPAVMLALDATFLSRSVRSAPTPRAVAAQARSRRSGTRASPSCATSRSKPRTRWCQAATW